jgi:predicted phage baseplate assembly protein
MGFNLQDTGIVDGSINAYVGQGAAFTQWTLVDSLVEWGPYDTVFTTQLNTDGSTSIVFGDGVNGAIPTSNQLVSASYKTSTGAAGNITAGQIAEVSFIPGNIDPNAATALRVTNATPATGGANADDNTQIRTKLKKSISARRRAVTLSDYEALSLLVPQVGRTKALAGTASSITLYVQPQNDGSVSPGVNPDDGSPTASMVQLQGEVSDYFSDKAPINTTVTVLPPTYIDLDLVVTVEVNRAYKRNAVRQAITSILLDPVAGLFAYNSYSFGETVALSHVLVALNSLPGIASVTVATLARHGNSGAANVTLSADELPRLLASNLTIETTGGLV